MVSSFRWLLSSTLATCTWLNAAVFQLSWDASPPVTPPTLISYQLWQSTGTSQFNLIGITTNTSMLSSSVDMTVLTRWYVKASIYNGQIASAPSETVTNLPAVPPQSALTFEAENGAITSPFATAGAYIQQVVGSGLSDGGRAQYSFTITNSGDYTLNVLLNAPNDAANSIYLNIDAEPTDPQGIWDIPITNGFENRAAAWRGSGTYDANQFIPKQWTLGTGPHTLIIRGREANVQIDRISVVPVAVTNPPPVIPAVTNLRATRISSSRLDLQWDAYPPMQVQVQRATGTAQFAVLKTLNAGTLHWTDATIQRNKTYQYRVCAVNPVTCSNKVLVYN